MLDRERFRETGATGTRGAGLRAARPDGSGTAEAADLAAILTLQQTAGNSAVGALLGAHVQREDDEELAEPEEGGEAATVDASAEAAAEAGDYAAENAAEDQTPAVDASSESAADAGDYATEESESTEEWDEGAAAVDASAGAASEVATEAADVAAEAVADASAAQSDASDTITNAADAAAGASETAGETATDASIGASGLGDSVVDAASEGWDSVVEAAQEAASDASDTARDAWNAVAGAAEEVATTAENAAASAWQTASDAASDAWNAVSDTAEDVADTVRDTAQDAWNGIRSAAGDAWDAVRDGASSLWNTVTEGTARGLEGIAENVAIPGQELQSRGLTSIERDMGYAIFGDALNYDVIVVTRGSIMSAGSSRTVGNTIDLAEEEFVGPGMTIIGEGLDTLMHEMTHVLQFQRGGLGYIPESLWEQYEAWRRTGDRNAAYDWRPLDAAGVPWDQWNVEQQAQAVQDYNHLLELMELGAQYDVALLGRLQKYVEYMRAGPHISPTATPAAEAAP